jgi:integrase
MTTNINIKFYLKNTTKKEFHKKIAGRIIHNRKKSEFMTDIYILEEDWNEKYCRSINDETINQRLALIEANIYTVKEKLIIGGYEITSKLVRDVYLGKDKIQYGIVEFIERYIEKKSKVETLSKSYKGKFKNIRRRVKLFVAEEYKTKDLMLSRVNYAFITSFDDFLHNQKSVQFKKPYSPTTIYKLHNFLRTVLIQAFKEGLIKKQPYVDFRLKKARTEIKYLTSQELDRLENLDLMGNGYLDKSRDIFLFSVYTGLRFRDAQFLTTDNLDKTSSDSDFIITKQEKTNDLVEIPILKPTQRIIDKYSNHTDRVKYKKLIPKISNAKINFYLKVIGELARISLKLTHHVARHTCATTVLLENNVPMEQVSKWLGHADLSSTKVYGKITKSRLDDTARRINKLF